MRSSRRKKTARLSLGVRQYFLNDFGDNTFKLFIIFVSFCLYMTISFITFNKLKARPSHITNADGELL
ncbi:MAG: hypothetical protein C0620_12065 [Desulfuromonas sp.]|nr:MAG: hypothetical protein C0620_12065 [Desulfuromonas sp.]